MAIPVYPGKPFFLAKFLHKYAELSARNSFHFRSCCLLSTTRETNMLGESSRFGIEDNRGARPEDIRQTPDGKIADN